MSDNATLERWGLPTADRIAQRLADGYWTPWHIAEARIAELEAEVATLNKRCADVLDAIIIREKAAAARIAELEAERNTLAYRIAELEAALAAEREACAAIADKYTVGGLQKRTAAIIATRIRARPAP